MASKITVYDTYEDDLIILRLLGIVEIGSGINEMYECQKTDKKYGNGLPVAVVSTWLKEEAEIHFTDERVTHRLRK